MREISIVDVECIEKRNTDWKRIFQELFWGFWEKFGKFQHWKNLGICPKIH